jgi:NhaP-type Na+/H+ or K+/H+ antiporter
MSYELVNSDTLCYDEHANYERMEVLKKMFKLFAVEASSYQFILLLSLMILIGLFAGRFFERRRIPNLTGYVLIGLLFGGIIVLVGAVSIMDAFAVIINVAIGFIAFSIGLELNFKKIKKRSREVIIVTVFQASFAFLLTFLALYVFVLPLHIALLIGSLAIATEPGPILLITKKLRANGPLTDTLVPLHGVEDAFTIMVFGVTLSYALSVENNTSFTFSDIFWGPIMELIFSIVIAIVIGYIFMRIIRYLKYEDSEKDLVVLVTAFVAIMSSIAIANMGIHIFDHHVHLSPILLPMGVGITFANLSTHLAKHETERIIDNFSGPILIAFFTVLGAEIVILVFQSLDQLNIWLMLGASLIYILFRFIGKISGSYVGGKFAKSSKNVRRYLGFCLLPQAQAAIGLAFYAHTKFGSNPYGILLLVIVLVSSLANELFGPLGVRYALTQCNEADDQACLILTDTHH